MLPLALAAIHLMSLAAGIAALMQRARALAAAEREEQLGRVFFWDNLYGLTALLWLGSGVWRAFGGLEKGTAYYLSNHVFWGKMLLLAALLALEGVAMVTFIRWRIRLQKKLPVPLADKARLLKIHWAEFWVVLGMIVMATLMARGVGVVKPKLVQAAQNVKVAQNDAAGAATAKGEAVYRRYCVSCHQIDGRGLNGKLAANFVDDPSRLAKSDAALAQSITHGIPGTAMVAFSPVLDESQVRSVLLYLRARFGPNVR